MLRSGLFVLVLGLSTSAIRADEPKFKLWPISEAESVIAVYQRDDRLSSRGDIGVIFAAWPDGHIVWSNDRIKGGAPYREGRIDSKKIAALLARFDKDGLFDDKKLNDAILVPDCVFNCLFIKSGKKKVKMVSWHEVIEASDDMVVDGKGIASGLEGRQRLDVLRKAPADYLFYRFVWSETRAKLSDLIPNESRPSNGEPHMLHGVLTWREPAAKIEPKGTENPSKK